MQVIKMSFIKHFDFLSMEPKFFVNSMSRYKNVWGAAASIIIMISTLSATIYFAVDLFEKKKPKVIYSEEINDDPFLDFTNFPFIFMIHH